MNCCLMLPMHGIDHSKTQIGYEISFTKHFYKPVPLRTLDEIKMDLIALQNEGEGFPVRLLYLEELRREKNQ